MAPPPLLGLSGPKRGVFGPKALFGTNFRRGVAKNTGIFGHYEEATGRKFVPKRRVAESLSLAEYGQQPPPLWPRREVNEVRIRFGVV